MILRLERVDSNAPVCIALFPEGTSYIGRGKLLECDDKKVAERHGELFVMDDSIYLKSLQQNLPCFVIKKGTNQVIVIKFEERFPLYNGDKIGFLRDNFWYEISTQSLSENQQCKEEPNNSKCSIKTEPFEFDESINLPAIDTPTKYQTNSDSDKDLPETSRKRPHDLPLGGITVKNEPITPTKLQRIQSPSSTTNSESNHTDNNNETTCDIPTSKVKTEVEDPITSSDQCSSAVIQDGTSPPQPAQIPAQPTSVRARCRYGVTCYRKNPLHMQQYSHPRDPDWDADRTPVSQRRRKGTQMVVRRGNCFYINAHVVHFHDDGFSVEDSDGEGADYDYEF